ncbi:VanZ family protein [Microbacterium terrisoli]|uniref:VanZ family protein n=1 Tax=Microbacterium terrisoli TaxID=3242192 RepID=UPI002804E1DA|nr:VanZ family protein [Microbacterium protaetiae]
MPQPRDDRRPRLVRDPRAWLAPYVVALALIAFWPSHVDEGMGPFLRALTRALPVLTYARVEFAANIALFVPLGVLPMMILRRRYLIVPIALVATVTIEAVQSLMGGQRTSSVLDVIANLTGACVGMLVVALVEWWRARSAG